MGNTTSTHELTLEKSIALGNNATEMDVSVGKIEEIAPGINLKAKCSKIHGRLFKGAIAKKETRKRLVDEKAREKEAKKEALNVLAQRESEKKLIHIAEEAKNKLFWLENISKDRNPCSKRFAAIAESLIAIIKIFAIGFEYEVARATNLAVPSEIAPNTNDINKAIRDATLAIDGWLDVSFVGSSLNGMYSGESRLVRYARFVLRWQEDLNTSKNNKWKYATDELFSANAQHFMALVHEFAETYENDARRALSNTSST